jgi:hypothetical protein
MSKIKLLTQNRGTNMSATGIWWLGVALLVVACFPLLIYLFFRLVVLERKSQSLIQDLKSSKAFEIDTIKSQLPGEGEADAA